MSRLAGSFPQLRPRGSELAAPRGDRTHWKSRGYPFQSVLSRKISHAASELREVRNRWAHNGVFFRGRILPGPRYRGALPRGNWGGICPQPGFDVEAPGDVRDAGFCGRLCLVQAVPEVHAPKVSGPREPAAGADAAAKSAPLRRPRDRSSAPATIPAPAHVPEHSVPSADPALPAATARFEVQAVDVLSYALAHNNVAIVSEVTVTYYGPELRGAALSIEALSPLGALNEPQVLLLDLDGTTSTKIREIFLTLDPARMLNVDSPHQGRIRFVLSASDDTVIAEHDHPVEILASNQWVARPMQLGLELVASFVQPNAAEIAKLAGETAVLLEAATGSAVLDGYQTGSRDRVDEMVRAAYAAMQARGIRYAEPPASWGLRGQKVRTPEEVLVGQLGTCLDTTVVLAALLEEIGINSTLWFLPGHVFLGYWRHESSLDTPAEVDASEAINYVGLGSIYLVETTSIPRGESFEQATRSPKLDHLPNGSRHFDGVADIQQARQAGILPLPSRSLDAAGVTIVHEYQVTPGTPALEHMLTVRGRIAPEERQIPARVVQWKNALLDLSLRNRLINYSGRGGHSLAVARSDLARFEDAISSGVAISLLPDDRLPEIERSRGSVRVLTSRRRCALLSLRTGSRSTSTWERTVTHRDFARSHTKRGRLLRKPGRTICTLRLACCAGNSGIVKLCSPLVLVRCHPHHRSPGAELPDQPGPSGRVDPELLSS